eukprot:GEMP01115500.1.p1 GENE.GEMP01115500.1~~GEMP01115500.1.p1  ORF type:complete len:164 (-),score=35.52 GEMP01115500.1:122-613(-)
MQWDADDITGAKWAWAHNGRKVNGWIETAAGGQLRTKWGEGTWRIQGTQLVVTFGRRDHYLDRTDYGFICAQRTGAPLRQNASDEETKGWPWTAKDGEQLETAIAAQNTTVKSHRPQRVRRVDVAPSSMTPAQYVLLLLIASGVFLRFVLRRRIFRFLFRTAA